MSQNTGGYHMPVIELEGNRRVVIEGMCTIVLYSAEEMRIKSGKLTICIKGQQLELHTLAETELSIIGLLMEITFLTGEG